MSNLLHLFRYKREWKDYSIYISYKPLRISFIWSINSGIDGVMDRHLSFKNLCMIKLLCELGRNLQNSISCKYSATSDGKGIVDGTGGREKFLVHQRALAGQIVQSAKEFAEMASQHNNQVKVLCWPRRQGSRWKGFALVGYIVYCVPVLSSKLDGASIFAFNIQFSLKGFKHR